MEKQLIKPQCPYFHVCGGCTYQDVSYADELQSKAQYLKSLLEKMISSYAKVVEPIVASPKSYHYRNRLDLKLKKTKEKKIFIGFTPVHSKGVVAVDQCAIAEEVISQFIPRLKEEAIAILPEKYKLANLVVRTGDDRRVLWGGIGRGSTRLKSEDYLWTQINNRRIHYSLDTFFQANLSILPLLFQKIRALDIWKGDVDLYDLYGGVGFFGMGLIDCVKRVILIEECKPAIQVAKYNRAFNHLENFEIIEGRVEEKLPQLLLQQKRQTQIAMIDPPRAGLSESAIQLLLDVKGFEYFLYLSCNPEALKRDLSVFINHEWEIAKVIPFDFFPKTKHLETLVLLEKKVV